jgi:hypothetical protein
LLVLLLLLLELLLLYFGNRTGKESLVDLVLEILDIFVEFLASAVDLRLDATNLGLENGTKIICHIVSGHYLVKVEVDDTSGNSNRVRSCGRSLCGCAGCVVASCEREGKGHCGYDAESE